MLNNKESTILPTKSLNRRTRVTSKTVKANSDSDLDPESVTQEMFEVDTLQGRNFTSPLVEQKKEFVELEMIHDENRRIMFDPRPQSDITMSYPVSQSHFTLKLACPRLSLHFNPATTVIGIVTCGGLCPGLNDVIRGLTLTGITSYHVKRVLGFRFGYWGLSKEGRHTAMDLTAGLVRGIHRHGGTLLGSSRGPQDPKEMVDTLVHYGVKIMFTVGGDGTQKGASKLAEEIARRGLDISVFGIPKTIDNDLSFSHRTFGYETAVEQAVLAIRAAHSEAQSHQYGVGVVKLMGRHSGFIAAQATISSSQGNVCLIPEMPISKDIFFQLLERRFVQSTYCVIVVAEGFGQNWGDDEQGEQGTDASGNKKLIDIGVVIKKMVTKWLKAHPKFSLSTVKYIDPSYMIRACPPSGSDAAFCSNLSTLAVHEAMAGCTNCIITQWYGNFTLVPIKLAVSLRKVVCTKGTLWRQVREVTVDIDGDANTAIRQELTRELRTLTEGREEIIRRLSKL